MFGQLVWLVLITDTGNFSTIGENGASVWFVCYEFAIDTGCWDYVPAPNPVWKVRQTLSSW